MSGAALIEAAPLLLGLAAVFVLFTVKHVEGVLIFLVLVGTSIRLGEPTFGVGPITFNISEASVVFLAVWFLSAGRSNIRGASATEWLFGLAISQSLSIAISLPLSVDTTGSVAALLGGFARTVSIVGVAGWVRRRQGAAQSPLVKPLMMAAVVLCAQALLLPGSTFAPELQATTTQGNVIRISGWAGGFLPGMVLVALAVAMAQAVHGRKGRIFWTALSALFAITIVLTYTRGAYIDVVVVAFLVLVLGYAGRRSWLPRAIAGVILVAAAASVSFALVPGIQARFGDLANGAAGTTLETRFLLWRSAIAMFLDHPVTGVGAGAFQESLSAEYSSRVPSAFLLIFNYPEHQILGLAAETGALGLASYIGGTVALGILITRRLAAIARVGVVSTAGVAVAAIVWGRLVSELGGTWFSGNDWLTLVVGAALGWLRAPLTEAPARRNDALTSPQVRRRKFRA